MTAEYTAGLLKWVQYNTSGFSGVDVKNFRAESWKDGLAFCALGARWRPDLVNFDTLNPADTANNVRLGFYAAEQMGVPLLLDAEDVEYADEKSYVAQLSEYYNVLKDVPPASGGASVAEPGSGFEGNVPPTPTSQQQPAADQTTFAAYEQQQQQPQEQAQPQDDYQYQNQNAAVSGAVVTVNVTAGGANANSYSNPYAQSSYNSDYANPVIPSGATAPATGNAFTSPAGAGMGRAGGGASLASQPVSSAGRVRGNGATGPDVSVFKQFRGILRIVVWCFCLMTFAIMSSQPGYDSFGAFQFVMAMAILCWLWMTFVIMCYLFQWKVNKYPYADYQLTVEFLMDVIWFVLVFISACVAANKCQEDIAGTRLCSGAHAAEGSIAMAFFAGFALAPTIFFSLRARREGQWAGAKGGNPNPYAANTINVNVTVQPGPGGQGQIV